jgi:pyrimidine-nucleoside phosphorylase
MMLPAALIVKKRDGQRLTQTEIESLVRGFVAGEVADYQMSAFAMAVCLRGMDADETAALTTAMLDSGRRLPRGSSDRRRVDKHSTGGLGDKVSLILAPLLAAADFHVPMISGRGLGLTGGTLDKLESIPGFRVDWEMDQTTRLLDQSGCCIIAANESIAPADRRLYALRDVTGTVESVALITASILSKKLAASLDALVMDVKVGSAAFMKTRQQAESLADSLTQTGRAAGLPVTAMLTDMDQPLGRAVGNAIEVNESIEVLAGAGPPEVRQLTIELCAAVIHSLDASQSLATIRGQLAGLLDSGAAMERFERMVHSQGGTLDSPFPLAPVHEICAARHGHVAAIDCASLGEIVVQLGGGRRRMGDAIRPEVGLEVLSRIGDAVDEGQPLVRLYSDQDHATRFAKRIADAFELSSAPVPPRPLILT